ncbi:hypothetical protein HZS55_09180 [Halosimplex rubrum]|uniref:Uncharacterized protein n=1 Tax=Halosimplex rubrum TaxID=869889 RepID=A0A7D5P087_9EURY|nr:hypothetical protein [Halosimplex rubrum]QLH77457.1 hypothetical protein HZS55_09180 [Halosimplex rubrum]
MAWIRHDSGEETVIKCQQVLGSASPLETDDDGYAEVGDDAADQLVALHAHLDHSGPPPDGASEESDGAAADTFDAGEFVDRTPMSKVVEDIESGDYDAHLEEIKGAAGRQGVQDAVDERRE